MMLSSLLVFVSVIFLDIILSGDNAVVIGMAANTLPKAQRNIAIILGMAAAAVLRIVLSLFATAALHYRLISILGGLTLLWVISRLVRDILAEEKTSAKGAEASPEKKLPAVIWTILVADVSMSLDNILAVAAVARNNPVLLVFGLVFSMACLAFGAKLVSGLLEKWPKLNWVGIALIAIVAVELIFGTTNL